MRKTEGAVAKPRPGSRAGQSLVEYALAILLIALVCIGGLGMLGAQVNVLYTAIAAAP